jgi:hypothetical protein
MKKERLTRVVTIETQLHDELKEFCERNGLKVKFVAREALRKYMESHHTTQSNAGQSMTSCAATAQ